MEEQNTPPIQEVQTPIPPLIVESEPKRRFHVPKFVFLGIVFVVLLTIIGGAYVLGKNQANNQPSAPIGSPEPTAKVGTPDPTSDWKTFADTNFNISFKYPPDFEASKSEDSIIINPKVKPCTNYPNCEYSEEIFVSKYSNTTINKQIKQSAGNIAYETIPITIDGIQGIRTDDLPGRFENDQVLVEKDGNVLEIVLIKSGLGKTISSEIFDLILSTFKFTQ